jgi:serine/threonine-protein kinase
MTLDSALSREHFQLEHTPPLCHLVELGSTNGTKVNDLRVERVLLRDGDTISAGDSCFRVQFDEAEGDISVLGRCCLCSEQILSNSQYHNLVPATAPAPAAIGVLDIQPRSGAVTLCERCETRRRQFPDTSPEYVIEDLIGEGGMGQVYRALQISQNRRVAIKMMIANSTAGEKAIDYFHREIQALQGMLMAGGRGHPGIVEFYDLFQVEGHLQLVMEYVDGKNALEWVRALGQPLPVVSAARIGRLLLSALHYAHSRGYVHRDIKPSNLLVMGPAHRPVVKLSDFGLAKSLVETNVSPNLTRQGDVGGSVGFLSPEHIRQFAEVREASDIYCAGATLFFLLTENYPFLGFDPRRPDAYEMVLEHPPVPLRAFRPDAPEGLERVLLKAMKKRPRDRFRSAQAMWQALRPYVAPSHA